MSGSVPGSPVAGSSGSAGSPAAAASPAGNSMQARLLVKQTIIDQWTTKEKLFLADHVARSGGDQNWVRPKMNHYLSLFTPS